MKKLYIVFLAFVIFFLMYFFVNKVTKYYDVLLPIYGGNSILYFVVQFFIIGLFVRYRNLFKINIFIYNALITLGMVLGIYILHLVIPSFMGKAFEHIGFFIYFFVLNFIVNIVFFQVIKIVWSLAGSEHPTKLQ